MSRPSRNLAVVFKGEGKVVVEDIGYPKMEDPSGKPLRNAVILKVLLSNICGTDLHAYRGRTDLESGLVLGHEVMGQVFEKGPDVQNLEIGDYVVVPSQVSCGVCTNCKNPSTVQFCSQGGGTFGFGPKDMWKGGQSEYFLAPNADFILLKVPKDQSKLKDIALLSDILPTGLNGAIQANVGLGSSVYIAGSGPVGLCCAASCFALGAAIVIIGDYNTARLAQAEKLGCKTIDLNKIGVSDSSDGSKEFGVSTGKASNQVGDDLQQAIKKILKYEPDPSYVDCSVDCVGLECQGFGTQSVLNVLFKITKAGGGIGIAGCYLHQDPKGQTEQERAGLIPLQWGLVWNKGIRVEMGPCPMQKYNRSLLMSIMNDRLKVADSLNIVTIPIEQAPEAYKIFNEGRPVKFMIDPHGCMESTKEVNLS